MACAGTLGQSLGDRCSRVVPSSFRQMKQQRLLIFRLVERRHFLFCLGKNTHHFQKCLSEGSILFNELSLIYGKNSRRLKRCRYGMFLCDGKIILIVEVDQASILRDQGG